MSEEGVSRAAIALTIFVILVIVIGFFILITASHTVTVPDFNRINCAYKYNSHDPAGGTLICQPITTVTRTWTEEVPQTITSGATLTYIEYNATTSITK